MNKKWIKIIDFLNMIHSGEKPPEKIMISGHRYRYNEKTKDYDSDIGFDNKDLFLHIGILTELDTEIGILEDNTEEIEEIGEFVDLIGMNENEENLFNMIKVTTRKVNELVRKINYIERKINGN